METESKLPSVDGKENSIQNARAEPRTYPAWMRGAFVPDGDGRVRLPSSDGYAISAAVVIFFKHAMQSKKFLGTPHGHLNQWVDMYPCFVRDVPAGIDPCQHYGSAIAIMSGSNETIPWPTEWKPEEYWPPVLSWNELVRVTGIGREGAV